MSNTVWPLKAAQDSDFSLANLPYGVLVRQGRHHCATRIGNTLVSLSVLDEAGLFWDVPNFASNSFAGRDNLNALLENEKAVWISVRQRLKDLVDGTHPALAVSPALQQAVLFDALDENIRMVLPIQIGDYTDFYASRQHATNVGTMFRGKDNALPPNWLHLPIGYHGRSSTVVCSPHSFPRPCGQLQIDPSDASQGSEYGPCKALDFELEMGAVVGGPPNKKPMSVEEAQDRIFGLVLLNDWSARDVQKFEYQPLGPFTSKNFCTTISPWIVPLIALEEGGMVVPAEAQEPSPLDYLKEINRVTYKVELTVAIQSALQNEAHIVCRSNLQNLYWTFCQQLAHHSVTGCVMKAGDLLGSGTISGSAKDSFGSLLELSWQGTKQVTVGNEQRKFLQNGDGVVLHGFCDTQEGKRIGFGNCIGSILPPLDRRDSTEELSSSRRAPTPDRFDKFELYGYWRSSSTWRVRVALAAKSIDYATIVVNLSEGENKSDDYLRRNPLGQVPMLECTDTMTGKVLRLTQSIAIIEFLDEIYPLRPSLLPKDPVERAMARQMSEMINAGTQPLQNVFWLKKFEEQSNGTIRAKECAKESNEDGLCSLELIVRQWHESRPSGPYCTGSFVPTMADAHLVAQIYNARRFGVDVEDVCPTLAKIEELCSAHPWFELSHPRAQPDAVN